MEYEEVTIIDSPVTTRYVPPGTKGQIDRKNNKIRAGGIWFDLNGRWKTVAEDEKRGSFLKAIDTGFISDSDFVKTVEAYGIDEQTAMDWMVEQGGFDRDPLRHGFTTNSK